MANRPQRIVLASAVLFGCIGVWAAESQGAARPPSSIDSQEALAEEILRTAGVAGGLCVHLGSGDAALSVALSDGGRFLVHALARDDATTAKAVRYIRSRGVYGRVWAEPLAGKALPYTENLVNLLVADDLASVDVPCGEILRVLCPSGVAYLGQSAQATRGAARLTEDALRRRLTQAGITNAEIIRRGGLWAKVSKPWPGDMDEWGHPRHGADGNPASADERVGPPRRVRWVSGPMHEASNMVTAGGRFFYAGLIACDAFNGLRLWERKLTPTPLRLGYPARAVAGSAVPVAAGDRVYVVSEGKLQALDAATGRTVRVYPQAAAPHEILYDNGVLVAVGRAALRALDARTGKLLWSHEATEPAGVVAGDGAVYLLDGSTRRGEQRSILKLEMASGRALWRQSSYPWAAGVRRCAYHKGLLVCEVSTFSNDRRGNRIHVLDGSDGRALWQRSYEPGMSHYVQARAIHTRGLLWVLHRKSWEALDPRTGAVRKTFAADIAHCYPPAATPRYLLAGEMGFTDVETGRVDSNRITKGSCGRETGFVPANGLVYCAPKHCACYPMMQGYAALAPAKASAAVPGKKPTAADFVLERGSAMGPPTRPPRSSPHAPDEWPCYRADMWRSSSTSSPVPPELEVAWTTKVGQEPKGPLLSQWKENRFIRGPITPPVVAGGKVFVAESEAHRIVALDAKSGQRLWDFTTNGRVDTPPTIFADMCLFGTRSGWAYCLRASDGQLAWRLRAAPNEERITYFGQLESPWPVPGSVLVAGGSAYFAAGRQALADGGILVLAVEPASGKIRWVRRITSLPIGNFYAGIALEFDPVDLLVAEADRARLAKKPTPLPADVPDYVSLSRWRFDPRTGAVNVLPTSGFACYRAGGGAVMAPRGLWTYGFRMDYIPSGPPPGKPDYVRVRRRSLMAFRKDSLFGTSGDKRRLFRRDFSAEDARPPDAAAGSAVRPSTQPKGDPIAAFNDVWFKKREAIRKNDRSRRLAEGAAWTADVFDAAARDQGVAAVVLAGQRVFVAGTKGGLFAFAAADGRRLSHRGLPAPVWDGMAAAYRRLYVSTCDGRVICLAGKR